MLSRKSPAAAGARSGLVIAAMCAAVIVVVTNTSSVGMAIPDISRDTGADQTAIQWIVDSYLLVLAALLLPAGALLDRYGRRRGVVLGLLLVAIGYLWAGYSDSAASLIAARCLSGVGGALALPGTLATITSVVPPEKRGVGIAWWAGSMMFAGALGVFFGGVCVDNFWWGSIFAVSAVAALACALFAAAVMPETRDLENANLDPVGALLSIVGIGAFVLGVTEGPVRGWSDPLTAGALALTPIVLGAFAWWELRSDRPMLDLRLFRDRTVGTGTLTVFVAFLAAYGWFFMMVQHLAFVLSYDALGIGLAFLPASVLLVPLALMGPRLAERYGRRAVLAVALGAMATGSVLLAAMASASFWPITIVTAVFLGGLGLMGGPATESIVESLPPARQGVASAINDVARELGAAIGIAVVGSAFNSAYRGRVGELLTPAAGPLGDVVRDSPAAGLAAAAQAGDAGPALADTVRHGAISGWTAAWMLVAVICALGAAYVAARFPVRESAHADEWAGTDVAVA